METLIEEKQIEELEEMERAIAEREMEEDPIYHLHTSLDRLNRANDILWNKGEQSSRDMVLQAIMASQRAIKLIKDQDGKDNNSGDN